MSKVWIALGLVGLPLCVSAHHSPNVHFDRNDVVEIEGILTDVKWQNPHVQLQVLVVDENGQEFTWLVEEGAANERLRHGVTASNYPVGATFRIAGFRGRRNPHALFSSNTLLPDGRELMSRHAERPRWSTRTQRPDDLPATTPNDAAPPSGLFRVWSHDPSGNTADGIPRGLWNDSYPLTGEARAAKQRWRRIEDNPFIRCQNGMPAIMDAQPPMEIVESDGEIVIRMEEQDAVRRIFMEGQAPPPARGPYGYSIGRWDGGTLVVTTTDIDWPWFDQAGIPQSEAMRLVERFTVSDDDRSLDYSITATDPTVFTEPVVMERRWIWIPGEEVKPYECRWQRDDL